MSSELEGKVAVVTGGASGIGAAIARSLINEGAMVVVADMSGRQDEAARDLGSGAKGFEVDVREEGSVEALIAFAIDAFGGLDVMCNNAGVEGDPSPLADCTLKNFDRVLTTNARGVFLGSKYAIPAMMKSGGGSIINTASIAGSVAFPTFGPYCASKGAVLALTRVVAVEYAAHGIRCNAICPGIVQTPMIDHVAQVNAEAAAGLQMAADSLTPLARLGTAEEIAAVATFLASAASSYITGTTITADGGFTAV